jgi:hypothetical protein
VVELRGSHSQDAVSASSLRAVNILSQPAPSPTSREIVREVFAYPCNELEMESNKSWNFHASISNVQQTGITNNHN